MSYCEAPDCFRPAAKGNGFGRFCGAHYKRRQRGMSTYLEIHPKRSPWGRLMHAVIELQDAEDDIDYRRRIYRLKAAAKSWVHSLPTYRVGSG